MILELACTTTAGSHTSFESGQMSVATNYGSVVGTQFKFSIKINPLFEIMVISMLGDEDGLTLNFGDFRTNGYLGGLNDLSLNDGYLESTPGDEDGITLNSNHVFYEMMGTESSATKNENGKWEGMIGSMNVAWRTSDVIGFMCDEKINIMDQLIDAYVT